MTKIFLALILIPISLALYSQEYEFEENDDTSDTPSGYVALFFIPGQIEGDLCNYMGGSGAIVLDKKYGIGVYGLRKTGNTYVTKGSLSGKMLTLGSAGVVLNYIFLCDKKIRPVVQIQAGWGGLTVSSTDYKGYAVTESFNRLLVMEPSLYLDVKLIWQLWLSAGIGYFNVNGVSFDAYTDKDFSGPTGFISIKILTGE